MGSAARRLGEPADPGSGRLRPAPDRGAAAVQHPDAEGLFRNRHGPPGRDAAGRGGGRPAPVPGRQRARSQGPVPDHLQRLLEQRPAAAGRAAGADRPALDAAPDGRGGVPRPAARRPERARQAPGQARRLAGHGDETGRAPRRHRGGCHPLRRHPGAVPRRDRDAAPALPGPGAVGAAAGAAAVVGRCAGGAADRLSHAGQFGRRAASGADVLVARGAGLHGHRSHRRAR